MSFAPIYVIGGRQRRDRSLFDLDQGWYGYDAGVILRVGPDAVETVLEYVSPAETHGPDDAVLFKSASLRDDTLFCCTPSEVVVYNVPSFELIAHVSLPRFNDVHHVLPFENGSVLVANSGLETVVQVSLDGDVLGEWNVLGEDTWSVFDAHIDYRRGVNLKPHRAHPNHLFVVDGEPWVSRFECKDLVAVRDLSHRIEIGGERVHDGIVRDGHVFVTTVDGYVVMADIAARSVIERHHLQHPNERQTVLGWCRGMLFDDASCWVGFSRIRPTRFRQTVSWVRQGGDSAPTRIDRYRTTDWALLESIDLEPHGLNAVFSIVPVPTSA